MTSSFLFATGIENSTPTIHNGTLRVDELEKCGHYTYWKKDFDLVQEMGIKFPRYGPPLYKSFTRADRFDWTFSDDVFKSLDERSIVPIVDLCHCGLAGHVK